MRIFRVGHASHLRLYLMAHLFSDQVVGGKRLIAGSWLGRWAVPGDQFDTLQHSSLRTPLLGDANPTLTSDQTANAARRFDALSDSTPRTSTTGPTAPKALTGSARHCHLRWPGCVLSDAVVDDV